MSNQIQKSTVDWAVDFLDKECHATGYSIASVRAELSPVFGVLYSITLEDSRGVRSTACASDLDTALRRALGTDRGPS